MNAVRSPEDIMPAIPPAGAAAPRVNPLQRIWLREIGMEKLWLKPAPAARQVDAQVVDLKRKRPSVRLGPNVRPGSPVALPVAAAPQAQAAPGRTRRRASPRPCAAARRPPVARQEPEVAEAPLIPVAERARNATLDELREQVVSCTACGLCQGRRHAVFGHGGQPARWLVVGEAPGEQEDRQGQPFVGRSGQLLDAMLSAVGMSRERDVFIANVIKCRPPGNRNPKPEEIAACSPYLMRQIELLARAHPGVGPLRRPDAAGHRGHHRQPARPRAPAQDRRRPANPRDRQLPPAYLLRSPVESPAPGKT